MDVSFLPTYLHLASTESTSFSTFSPQTKTATEQPLHGSRNSIQSPYNHHVQGGLSHSLWRFTLGTTIVLALEVKQRHLDSAAIPVQGRARSISRRTSLLCILSKGLQDWARTRMEVMWWSYCQACHVYVCYVCYIYGVCYVHSQPSQVRRVPA